MKLLVSWLTEYVDLSAVSLDHVVDTLAALGLPVEGVERTGAVPGVVTARVVRTERHHIARGEVGRAAPHVTLGAVAGVDPHPLDLGCVGVTLGAQHTGRHDPGHAADLDDLLDREAEHGERVGEPVEIGVGGQRHVLAEPGQEELHVRTAPRTGCRR